MRNHCRRTRHGRQGARALSLVFLSPALILGAGVFLFAPRATVTEQATPTPEPVLFVSQTAPLQRKAVVPAIVQMTAAESRDDLRGDEPTVLIYHTHTTEAYTQTNDNPYVETSSWRTNETDKSVVAVGKALAERLRREYGYCVIHDTTNHEPPKLSTAYERSEETMRAYAAKYPTLRLFIDIHRDAYTVTGEPTSDYAVPYGDETCRVMCVVGEGTNYEIKPHYAENLTLAQRLTERLIAMDERLARPVRIKSGRYNQHIYPACLLIEVGHNANTLEQALAVVPYLADALALTLDDVEPSPTEQPQTDMWVPETFDKP